METGFVGLGKMGVAMAERLLAAGHAVYAWNRSAEPVAALAAKGASAAPDPAAAAECGVVVSMLASDDALVAVTEGEGGLLAGLPAGGIHVVMGTHSVAAIERLASAHREAGQVLVAAPVLGRPEAVIAGKMGIVAGGDPAAVARVAPLFEAMGRKVFPAGVEPAGAASIKIANNFLLGSAIEAMAEAFCLTEHFGVDPIVFYEVVTDGLFAAPAYQSYGKLIAEKSFDLAGFTATLGLKDANLAHAAAERAGIPMPTLDVWRERLTAVVERGEGECDWSVMAREQARRAGLG